MYSNAKQSFCNTVLGMALATVASAQQILPFPPTPSASTAGLTMEDSDLQEARRAEAPG